MAKRVSLTKKQQASQAGSQLLNLCKSISADGQISKEEIVALRIWLRENEHARDEIPAVGYLSDLVTRILSDKKVTTEELAELAEAIEKVLPPVERSSATESRKSVERQKALKRAEKNKPVADAFCPYCKGEFGSRPKVGRLCPHCGNRFHVTEGKILTSEQYNQVLEERAIDREAEWRGGRIDAPTANQLALMIRVGITIPSGCTEKQASRLLDSANLDDNPSEEDRRQWLTLRNQIIDRIRRGESIDSIISRPPAATTGCLLFVALALIGGICRLLI